MARLRSAQLFPLIILAVLLAALSAGAHAQSRPHIKVVLAATELIVPNGQPVSLGGSTASLHEITRQILGYRERASSGETKLVVTATVR
jgi:hypothetical protein